jgi:hypothetical protein
MVEKEFTMNKSLGELVAEDKKLTKYHSGRTKHREPERDDRDARRFTGGKYGPNFRERSFSGGRRGGIY